MAGYTFDLTTNALTANYVANPTAGREHRFIAYRPISGPLGPQVMLR